MLKIVPYLMLICCIFSCQPVNEQQTGQQSSKTTPLTSVQYAKGFSIEYFENYKLITVHQPSKAVNRALRYVLVSRGTKPNLPAFENAQVIEIPVRSVVCLSTTHAPLFEQLGEADRITGFADAKYISSPVIRKNIAAGKIREIGRENGINLEAVIDLQPDLVMAYSMGGSGEAHGQLTAAGQKVVLNAEYLEATPLGKAEWIKFAAAFLDREQEAEKIFSKVVNEYQRLSALAQKAESVPSVFVDIPYSGTWYMPGGNSFAARFLKDAGANYLWKTDSTSGSMQLSLEAVYEKAHTADLWINTGSYASLAELTAADARFKALEAVKKGNVYNNNRRFTAEGGNEYWELGVVRPDLVLADLVKIFHPELLPGHELYFYQRLR